MRIADEAVQDLPAGRGWQASCATDDRSLAARQLKVWVAEPCGVPSLWTSKANSTRTSTRQGDGQWVVQPWHESRYTWLYGINYFLKRRLSRVKDVEGSRVPQLPPLPDTATSHSVKRDSASMIGLLVLRYLHMNPPYMIHPQPSCCGWKTYVSVLV